MARIIGLPVGGCGRFRGSIVTYQPGYSAPHPIFTRTVLRSAAVQTYECWYCLGFGKLILFRLMILCRPLNADPVWTHDTVQTFECWYCSDLWMLILFRHNCWYCSNFWILLLSRVCSQQNLLHTMSLCPQWTPYTLPWSWEQHFTLQPWELTISAKSRSRLIDYLLYMWEW